MFKEIDDRLEAIYTHVKEMRGDGLSIDAIPPMGAIYLSVRFDLVGKNTPAGQVLNTTEDIRKYLLEAADIAVVPFHAFDLREETGWCRLSVGATSVEEIEEVMPKVRAAINALK